MKTDLNDVALFLETKAAEAGAAENTLAAYARDLKHASFWCANRSETLRNLSRADIEAYLVDLSSEGLSSATRARRLSAIKQFFQFCVEEGWRKDNPSLQIRGGSKKKKLPKTLSLEEVDRLLDVAMQSGKNEAERLRDSCLMQLLYATGMRVSELMALPVAATRGNPAMILVKGKGSKERLVPLSTPARDALAKWIVKRDQKDELSVKSGHASSAYLFPSSGQLGHLTRHWFYGKIKFWATTAGIDPSKISPHTIRHAFASHLLANGADLRIIQTLLGHADVATTEIYTHVLDEKLQSLVEDHHPLAKRDKSAL
ncbi:MAG: site-specific tyrosine recombinase XerD [Rhodobacteraceae bacterium]|nr:site-specific tyrosine recombinase XerD [Paracoccaceae bacterium]